ncbi:hypothetical protein BVRB_9g209190 [Beta vulgaris subsp. vulgaris]|uniref:E3 ubiquitin-protein ligase ATL41 n=1 Tax=Beta vulgaris subsp. vulgaris TaxID=3555 RepID=UPI00053F7A59|nr:E3 ubiquitin-protein ligase ATL41 [Beta vulgaris subsp. vulgaris]KMT01893.1 hypothetical protein BVRB_9g209190 [Beta vulgaris subsp. vulgaris]
MDFNNNNPHNTRRSGYDPYNQTLVIAILCLSFVIILVIILHIYARCVLRHSRRNTTTSITFIHRDLTQPAESVSAKSGLDPTVINLLPSFMFKKIDGHDDDHIDECAVCLSTLEEDELARRLPNCNHVFHMACIDTWLSGQITCPICRSDASPKLVPHDREPPIHSVSELTEVVVVTSEAQCDHNNTHVVINSGDGNNPSKINTGSGPSSSSSFRMSSFRKMIGRDRSSSSNRLQVCGDMEQQTQVQQNNFS